MTVSRSASIVSHRDRINAVASSNRCAVRSSTNRDTVSGPNSPPITPAEWSA
jgi:hypothetical protein